MSTPELNELGLTALAEALCAAKDNARKAEQLREDATAKVEAAHDHLKKLREELKEQATIKRRTLCIKLPDSPCVVIMNPNDHVETITVLEAR